MGSENASDDHDVLRIIIGGAGNGQNKRRCKEWNRIKTTKYTLLTFVPMNLFQQFRRAAYFYYLVVTIVSFFVNSTISPMTSLIPLVFVVVVTAVKQGREDFLRYKADNVANSALVTVLRNGKRTFVLSKDVAPGDLVLVERDCDVPCDLVLLHTTDPHGKCFITTANLDGETNLKTLLVPPHVPQLDGRATKISTLGAIVCERPTTDLYTFHGKIELHGDAEERQVLPLTAENLLLRGARVKNTESVIGCATYTGMTTKMQLNCRLTGNKSASSEVYINRYLLALVVAMIVFVTGLYLLQRHEELVVVPMMYFLGAPIDVNRVGEILEDYLSFLILFNYMVPISMYMNVEIYRVFGALFMKWDQQLYDKETDQPFVANTSDLNEELGQVNILFSDKTGTLTKNEMRFQRCSINGLKYVFRKTHLEEKQTGAKLDFNNFNVKQKAFLEALALCHTVQVASDMQGNATNTKENKKLLEKDQQERGAQSVDETEAAITVENGYGQPLTQHFGTELESELSKQDIDKVVRELAYQAASADEVALVEACAHLGLVYLGDARELLRLRIMPQRIKDSVPGGTNELLRFRRLHVLEFTAERRRMSVIVQAEDGTRWLHCKGAESAVVPLCTLSSSDMNSQTDEHIDEFATLGLRTLAVASREITEQEYEQFSSELHSAKKALHNRKTLTEQCYARIEKNLELIGATAVEDALQDDVAGTLSALQRADIKVWVLTGDKVETAQNIALSCGHIPARALKHFIINCGSKALMLHHLNTLAHELSRQQKCALLMDGKSIATALTETRHEFRDLALKCSAVLCCRLSPLQKSEVVALIKTASESYITAAIGDGANDVSMIEEAHVGIGITGKEGRQAARCADFALAKFCMLRRLLLVHGHYHTARLSFLVLFYFYKNFLITGCMFLYQFYNLSSATSVYHSIFLWLYDVIYISFSLTFASLTEKPHSEETLMSNPGLYKQNLHNRQLRWSIFLFWIAKGIYHSLVIFYFAYFVYTTNDVILNVGQTADFTCFGTILIQLVVIVGNLKLMLDSTYLSYWYIFIIIASIVAFMLSTLAYNVAVPYLHLTTDIYWVYNKLLTSLPVWLFTILTTVACLLPDFTFRVMRKARLNLR